ncbi:MAG TPA: hypothetical protein PKV27_12585, partial [Ilumatobacteraceae bacterium]|nr:hypothetical protein [Ilumatobacteraceae bacterium]
EGALLLIEGGLGELEISPAIMSLSPVEGGYSLLVTAGFIDPGFDGHITLELTNIATLPITLYPRMKVGQVSFMMMTTAADRPYGSGAYGSKYHGQRGPTPSRYFENFPTE